MKILENPKVNITVCALFVIALLINGLAGGSLPGFVASPKLDAPVKIAHGPTFPPDPWNRIAHSPTFPPDPWNRIAHSPTFPPDPWNRIAHGPTFPPDPWRS